MNNNKRARKSENQRATLPTEFPIDQLAQNELFTFLADHIPALLSYIDTNQRYKFINKRYTEWLGLKPEKVLNKRVTTVRGITAYKLIGPYMDKALRGEQVSYDHILKKHDGTTMHVNASYTPHLDNHKKVIGIFALVSDITERKQAELLLKETEKKFTKLTDSNVIGVTVTDLNGKIYETNDIYLDMLGFSRQDFAEGKLNWKNQTPPEFMDIQKKAERETLETGSAVPYEKEYLRKDGTRISVLIGNVLLDKTSKKILAFIVDISKQKELEQRKDEFIALASHELRTPLTSLQLFTQMIGRDIKKKHDKQLSDNFSKMEKQLAKVNKLVTSLLDVSRIEAGKLPYKKQLFSLQRLTTETVEELQSIYQNHKLVITNNPEISVRADRERIKQVLSNLINNAVKYSPHLASVKISVTQKGNVATIAIQDFGIGIPQPLQKTIFDRYYQITGGTVKSSVGLGLGLYLAKEIVKKHRGEIWVESKTNEGSTFHFTLPTIQKAQLISHPSK